MTAQDILLKLLPFTHKENGIVVFTSNLSFGDWIVTIVEIILLLIFFISLLRLLFSYRKDIKNIQLLETEITKLKKQGFSYYNDFLNNLKKNTRIYHLWNEFDESLIKREDKIENSLDADYFFNEKSLATHVGTKFYSAIPGILLGVGLLGTFFALYVALVELNLEGDNLKESIRHFIGMVGVKFTASVWGILLSVIFTFIEKFLEGKLLAKIKSLQDEIDKIFKRQTAEQNLYKIANESEQQTRALNSLAETLTQKISEQFNPIIAQMNNNLEQMPYHISAAIEESLKEPLKILGENAKNAVQTQSENLGNLVNTFIDKLDSAAGEQTQNIQTLIARTTKELSQLLESIRVSNEEQIKLQQQRDIQLQEKFNQIMNNFNEQIEHMEKVFETVNTKAATNINEIYSKQQEAVKQQHEEISKQSSNIVSNMNTLLEKLVNQSQMQETKIVNLMEEIQNYHKEFFKINQNFAKEMEESTKNILENIELKVREVKGIIDNIAVNLVEIPAMLKTFTNSTQELQNFGKSAEEASSVLTKVVNEMKAIQSNLKDQLERSNEFTIKMNEVASSTLDVMNSSKETTIELQNIYKNIIEENRENLDELGNAMSKWLAEFDQQVHATMQNSLNEVQSALANFANTLSNSIASMEDILETINEKLEK